MKHQEFTYNDKLFEIIVEETNNEFCVSVLQEGTLVSPKYRMSFEVNFDISQQNQQKGIVPLIAIAKFDIENETYYRT